MRYYKTSEKKQLLIDKVNGSEIVKGDCVFIKQKDIPFSFFFNYY